LTISVTPVQADVQGCQSLLAVQDRDDAPAWAQHRYLANPGESQSLYIADVDGAVLVIDASVGANAPFENRIEVDTYLRRSIEIGSREQ
jgi:hypothetical protein